MVSESYGDDSYPKRTRVDMQGIDLYIRVEDRSQFQLRGEGELSRTGRFDAKGGGGGI